MAVMMTCMTTKKKFEVESPPVVELRNGRYAYRAECPWEGKGGKKLFAYKFCSREAFETFQTTESEHPPTESEHFYEGEQIERPESPTPDE